MGCNTPPMPPEPERPGQRKVFCVKFQREMPGLDEPPFDAELGKRIYSPRAARPNFRFLCPI